mgnify:CR=1 FL=1
MKFLIKKILIPVFIFAGLKAVGESVAKPWEYYENNIAGTLTLVDVMRKHNSKEHYLLLICNCIRRPGNYPDHRRVPERTVHKSIWMDKIHAWADPDRHSEADPEWNVVLLRYFNPIGAHKSGTIGENPNGIPNNLMPYITQVAVGKLKELGVFGNDYDTPDGTGVRDYIHVVDLAKGHVKALKKIEDNSGLSIYNLGTGKGLQCSWYCEEFLKLLQVLKFHMWSSHVVQAISQPAIPMLPKQRENWDGKPKTVLKKCVQTPGDGSPITRMVMKNN